MNVGLAEKRKPIFRQFFVRPLGREHLFYQSEGSEASFMREESL